MLFGKIYSSYVKAKKNLKDYDKVYLNINYDIFLKKYF